MYSHTQKTVAELLEEKDIDITEFDKVSPSLNTEITRGMVVKNWEQARIVNISVDGEQTSVWTTESNFRTSWKRLILQSQSTIIYLSL
ncbi:ubiquitin-like domain-containing protein [Ureibacillus acetophenoni]